MHDPNGQFSALAYFYSIHYIAKIIKDKHEKVCDGKQMVVENLIRQ